MKMPNTPLETIQHYISILEHLAVSVKENLYFGIVMSDRVWFRFRKGVKFRVIPMAIYPKFTMKLSLDRPLFHFLHG